MRQCPRKPCEYGSDDVDAYVSHMNDHYREEASKAHQQVVRQMQESFARAGLAQWVAGYVMEGKTPEQALDAYAKSLRAVMEKGAF